MPWMNIKHFYGLVLSHYNINWEMQYVTLWSILEISISLFLKVDPEPAASYS